MELIVDNLACTRGGLVVLEGVSFRLSGGRALVLRGPNGIGKTTLLRTLAGVQPALEGEIVLPPESLTYAGHADGVKPTLSVAENLAFWAKVHGHGGVDAAIARLNLVALRDRAAQNLSAGQRRRLGLARLLVTGRSLWLLDEPTVSLDIASVALFGSVLADHLAAGGAALIATHIDIGVAADVLDLTPFKARQSRMGAFDEAFA